MIIEFRVVAPFTLQEYERGTLHSEPRTWLEEKSDSRDIDILTSHPFFDETRGHGTFTHSICRFGDWLPTWVESIAPPSAFVFEVRTWSAFPYSKTIITCPFFRKFETVITTLHVEGGPFLQNVHCLDADTLSKRVVDIIDIAQEAPTLSMVNQDDRTNTSQRLNRDPKIAGVSTRGPLSTDWVAEYIKDARPMLTCYKLVTATAPYWSISEKIERLVTTCCRESLLLTNRNTFAWCDDWMGLTLQQITEQVSGSVNDTSGVLVKQNRFTSLGREDVFLDGLEEWGSLAMDTTETQSKVSPVVGTKDTAVDEKDACGVCSVEGQTKTLATVHCETCNEQYCQRHFDSWHRSSQMLQHTSRQRTIDNRVVNDVSNAEERVATVRTAGDVDVGVSNPHSAFDLSHKLVSTLRTLVESHGVIEKRDERAHRWCGWQCREVRATAPQLATAVVCNNASPKTRRSIDWIDISNDIEFDRCKDILVELQHSKHCDAITNMPTDEKLAFWLNVYNGLVLYSRVIDVTVNLKEGTTLHEGDIAHDPQQRFYSTSFVIGAHTFTLTSIEHSVLRCCHKLPNVAGESLVLSPRYDDNDPRSVMAVDIACPYVTFGLCTATESGPELIVYTAATVQDTLIEGCHRFLDCNVMIDSDERRILLPKVLYWYTQDFGTNWLNVIDFVIRFLSPTKRSQMMQLLSKRSVDKAITVQDFNWSECIRIPASPSTQLPLAMPTVTNSATTDVTPPELSLQSRAKASSLKGKETLVEREVAAPSFAAKFNLDMKLTTNVQAGSNTTESQPWHIPRCDLILQDVIATGGFAKVWQGKWRDTVVAIKVFHLCDADTDSTSDVGVLTAKDIAVLEKEGQTLSRLNHPNLVQFIGACAMTEPDPTLVIVMELCQGGSLQVLLRDKTQSFNLVDAVHFGEHVGKALGYLHSFSPPIIHRDVRSANVLLSGPVIPGGDRSALYGKLTDFGVTCPKRPDGLANSATSVGSVAWSAPELLRGERYGTPCDIYAFGVLLWELSTRKQPFEGLKRRDIYLAVAMDGRTPPLDEMPTEFQTEFRHIVGLCLQRDPETRPDANAATFAVCPQ